VEPSHFASSRPDILAFLPDSSHTLDLVVSHPSAPSHLALAAAPLACAKSAESRKVTRYASDPSFPSSSLIPFSLETYGAFGPRATDFITSLLSLSRDPASPSLPTPPIFHSLAILLQRCNAYILSRGVVTARASFHPSRSFSSVGVAQCPSGGQSAGLFARRPHLAVVAHSVSAMVVRHPSAAFH
jgi:hypothetical protein